VLDVACGGGRHMHWFQLRGHRVCGVDRSPEAVAASAAFGDAMLADIEQGAWPYAGREFDSVIVTNYLWRARLPAMIAAVAPGGVLLYETFAAGNETVGKPSRADFLLSPGELLAACADLRVGDTGGDLLDRKGEAHIGTRFGRWEREPTIQMQGILVPVPIALGDIVTPATHLLNTSLASYEKLFSLG